MNKKEIYKKYLSSKEWKEKRLRIIRRDRGVCVKCKSNDRLEVHHLTYKRIFNELDSDLITLCHVCHKKEHDKPVKRQYKQKRVKIDCREKVKCIKTVRRYKEYLYKQRENNAITEEFFREEMLFISKARKKYENKKSKKKIYKKYRYSKDSLTRRH